MSINPCCSLSKGQKYTIPQKIVGGVSAVILVASAIIFILGAINVFPAANYAAMTSGGAGLIVSTLFLAVALCDRKK